MKTLIAEGAEAKIYKAANGEGGFFIIKERIVKEYRLKELDEKIRKQRTRREILILTKASKIISTPKISKSSSEIDYTIIMEFIDGLKISENLDNFSESKRKNVCGLIGKNIALLHNNNIIHGDLTTSNMLLKENELFFIDFGLSFVDIKAEHKAVDLHLLKQALESKHYKHYESSFQEIINSYKDNSKDSNEILERLEKVEGRGRYKSKQNNK